MTNARGRRKRFRRSHTDLRLTADDLSIIDHVGQHRFLRSTHLASLLPHRSPKKLIERVGALYHAGYLDRPKAQLDYYSQSGNAPLVYALGDRSHVALPIFGEVDWSEKNRTVKRPYIEHALLIADIMVAIEVSVRERRDLEFVPAHELARAQPPPTRATWTLDAQLHHAGRVFPASVIPDAVFALRHASGRLAYFFLEADRGMMRINSADLSQSSYWKKLATYDRALKAQQPKERFGFSNLRILTVTTSASRIANMLDIVNELSKRTPTGRYLFRDIASLASGDLLSGWQSNGGLHRLDVATRR